jgi:hypothetical protein
MFESAPPPDALPDFGPVGVEGWAEPVDPETQALLDGLAASYAAAPAAGVLPFAVAELPPGPELAALLARCDVSQTADAYDVVEAVAGWQQLAAWVAAGEARALAELAGRAELRPADTGYRSVNPITNTAVVVAGRCQLTARQAENDVGHAVQLVVDFPDTWAALSAGLIDLRQVRAITDELGGQDPAIRARVEAAVLPVAPTMDSVALRKLIKRLLHELAPVETAERHRVARDRRHVSVTPASDGMAFLEALLPAEDAVAINTALNVAAADAKRADAAAGLPSRTKDQRRADALAELGWAALAACADAATGHAAEPTETVGPTTPSQSTGGAPRRRPVAVNVTIPFTALAGLSDEPGELDGYGPIPAHVARELAAGGVWRWLRTDPGTGQLLDLGRTKYRPTKALADFIIARDRTCRMPGCHQPASTADIDHIVPFADGGTTCPAGCHALCETHHLLKHRGGWRVHRQRDGTTIWTSPTGHRYLKPPDPVGATSRRPPHVGVLHRTSAPPSRTVVA